MLSFLRNMFFLSVYGFPFDCLNDLHKLTEDQRAEYELYTPDFLRVEGSNFEECFQKNEKLIQPLVIGMKFNCRYERI